MKLRPHHVLDIIRHYGHGLEFKPNPYGHAAHTVAQSILSNLDLEIELVVGADEICRPCMHLDPDGQCDDVLHKVDPSLSKQKYNDGLDERILDYLGLTTTSAMTVRKYLEIVAKNLPGLEKICAHPRESQEARLQGLQQGLAKLGISGR